MEGAVEITLMDDAENQKSDLIKVTKPANQGTTWTDAVASWLPAQPLSHAPESLWSARVGVSCLNERDGRVCHSLNINDRWTSTGMAGSLCNTDHQSSALKHHFSRSGEGKWWRVFLFFYIFYKLLNRISSYMTEECTILKIMWIGRLYNLRNLFQNTKGASWPLAIKELVEMLISEGRHAQARLTALTAVRGASSPIRLKDTGKRQNFTKDLSRSSESGLELASYFDC